jgi:hypothetical protein
MNYYLYDLEVFPNIFLFGGKFYEHKEVRVYEISDRMNNLDELIAWLSYLRNCNCEMVGFNNLGYDYPILHELMTNPYTFTYDKAFQLSQQIITTQRRGVRLNSVRPSDRLIPQIDLVKVHHFDNDSKRTSLKALQFAMRSESLEDLPFKIRPLEHQEKDQLRTYNVHDLTETEKFLTISLPKIEMRREFLADGVLYGDVLNFSDVKIGTEMLVKRIGREKCFKGGKPNQTFRTLIEFNKIILSKIYYRTEVFNQVLEWFRKQVYYVGGDNSINLSCRLAGLDFHFGVGGVHASADNKIFHSDESYQIIDIDVSGMYPAVAIANGFAPAHLGESFIGPYKQITIDRARYPKGTSRNLALKLAGNGAYGNSNNPFSPLYDPQYTFSVTVNGQLQILQLVEFIDLLPDCELIQANTDGITVRIKKENEWLFKAWCKIWEEMTGLVLEEVKYKRMWIRDVNNYIAEYENGKLKRKGTYFYPTSVKEYDDIWNKNFSNIASVKAAEKAMTHSWPLEVAIKLMTDPFDFMFRYKATGESVVYIGEVEQLRTVRYYISKSGQPMKKISPPKGEVGQYKRKNGLKDAEFEKLLKEIGKDKWDERIHTKNKSKYDQTITSIESGWKVKECNLASKFDWNDVDWDYYIEEAKKIIIGVRNVQS